MNAYRENVLYEYYISWSKPAKEGYNYGLESSDIKIRESPSEILFCGMGGSGAVGLYAAQILNTMSDKTKAYVELSHRLPSWVNNNTLVIAISFSGNTLETLTCAEKALKKGAKVIGLTRGGKLSKLEGLQGLLIAPEAPAPRAGFTGMLFTILGLLAKIGLMNLDMEVEATIRLLEEERNIADNLSTELSEWLLNTEGIPTIVSGASMYPVIIRAKNELAENAKLSSIVGFFPESGHNDIVPWTENRLDSMLIIDPSDDFETKTINAAIKVINPKNIYRIRLHGQNYLTQLIWPTWIIGLASIKYAIDKGIDPNQIRPIDKYKKFLKELL